MNNNEEWKEFLNRLLSNATCEYKNSKEYEYVEKRQNQIDEFLSTNLTYDQKTFVQEIIFELGLETQRGTEVVYQQGFKDCVWMLKNLGVLA